MEENPWHGLPDKQPFVLPEDKDMVEAFNVKAHENHRLRLDFIPEPFVGRLEDARLVLLGNNPGFKNAEAATYRLKPAFANRMRDNLLHRASEEFPFIYFDPDIIPPTNKWWERKLRHLFDEFGKGVIAKSILAKFILSVEFFPYVSHRYRHGTLRLPSQEYSFALVRKAMNGGAVIVAYHGERRWLKAIPELDKYHRLVRLKEHQQAPISPNNCRDNGWSHIEDVVRTIKAKLR